MKKFVLKARLEYLYIEHGLMLYILQITNDLKFSNYPNSRDSQQEIYENWSW